MLFRRLIVLLLSMAVVAAACGDTEVESGTSAPVVAGVCTEEEPDCVDTVIPGTDDDVITTDGGGAVSGFVVDDGLSVTEALATDATGVLAVNGFLFGDDQGWRLCEVLAESFPPQCGGPALPLGNFDQSSVDNLPVDEDITIQENQGITWSDNYMLFFGEIVDGTLMIDIGVIG